MSKEKAFLNTVVRERILPVYALVATGMVVLSTCTRAAEAFSIPGLNPDESFRLVSRAVLDSGFLFGVGLVLLSQAYLLSVPRASGILAVRLTAFSSRRRFLGCLVCVSLFILTVYLAGLVLTMALQLKGWRIEDAFLGTAIVSCIKVGMVLAVLMLAGIVLELLTGLPGPAWSLGYLLLTSELGMTSIAQVEWVSFGVQVLVLLCAGTIAVERRDFP